MVKHLKGVVFNIQRYSLHDGPGVRTTVFLKGCPLDCKWCANPESKNAKIEILYDRRKCVGCDACLHACRYGANKRTQSGRIAIDKKKCVLCMSCVQACVQHALMAEGKTYTVEALLEEVLKDNVFYVESGGGVTLSGGEPLAQGAFAIEFLKQLKRHNLHTVVETCGYVGQNVFEKACKWVDLFYFDVKHYDAKKHKEKTGVSNELILKNLQHASEMGNEIVARIPVIPDFNDTLDDAAQYVKLLGRYHIQMVHLLPFHQYGSGKYEQMGLEYPYADRPNMDKAELKAHKDILESAGLTVQIGG